MAEIFDMENKEAAEHKLEEEMKRRKERIERWRAERDAKLGITSVQAAFSKCLSLNWYKFYVSIQPYFDQMATRKRKRKRKHRKRKFGPLRRTRMTKMRKKLMQILKFKLKQLQLSRMTHWTRSWPLAFLYLHTYIYLLDFMWCVFFVRGSIKKFEICKKSKSPTDPHGRQRWKSPPPIQLRH